MGALKLDTGPRAAPVAVLCALTAVALGLLTAVGAARGNGVTVLVHMSAQDPMSQLVQPSFSFVGGPSHYDGVYYYAIARDPLARGDAHELIDSASYRYGHPGYGWLAWVVGGGGRPGVVPAALLLVSLLGLGVAGAAASVLARDLGMSPWWGLSVALNPGLLFAVTVDGSETVGVALVFLTLLAWRRERWLTAGLAVAAGCFTKEPLVLVPAGLLVWEAAQWARRGRPERLFSRASAIVVGPLLYAVWLAYVGWTLLVFPFEQISQLDVPPGGWTNTLERAEALVLNGADAQVGMLTPALLVAASGALALGLIRAVRIRGPHDPIYALLVLIAVCSNWMVLLFPKDLFRTMAFTFALLPFVLAGLPDRKATPGDVTGSTTTAQLT